MALLDNEINWNELIKFTVDGIYVADFQQIKASVTKRFKEIYGEDIDLATTSADGIYVQTLCLIINNILQSFKQFYSQLDVDTASGIFLDSLCALSNVVRQPESYSTAKVKLTYNGNEPYTTNEISLLDKNGNIWKYSSNESITFEPDNLSMILVFTCTIPGPVRADKGWIDKLVENNVEMSIEQQEDADIGEYQESDDELKRRRNSSLSSTGMTLLDTLAGSLLQLPAIEDVLIYNNDSNSVVKSQDNTSIGIHDTYIVIRRQPNINIDNNKIGQTIYEKMTPGIRTTKFNDSTYPTTGVQRSYQYVSSSLGIPVENQLVQNVYWKEARPVKDELVITIKPILDTGFQGDTTINSIFDNIINNLNKKKISSRLNKNELWNIVMSADILYKNNHTFQVVSMTLGDNDLSTDYQLHDNYFYFRISKASSHASGDDYVLSISY